MTDRIQRHLLPDDSVLLDVDPRLERAVSSWVALDSCRSDGGARWESRLLVHHAPALASRCRTRRRRCGSARSRCGWAGTRIGRSLGATERDCAGAVDLNERQATVVAGDAAGPRLHTALTFATALLLGRLGQALVHAAAVVQPEGGAWLLAGGAGSGEQAAFTHLTLAGWPGLRDQARGAAQGWRRRRHRRGGAARTGRRSRDDRGVAPARRVGGACGRAAPAADAAAADGAGAGAGAGPPHARSRPTRRGCGWTGRVRPASSRAMHGGLRLPTFELRQGLDTLRGPRAPAPRCSTALPAPARPDGAAPLRRRWPPPRRRAARAASRPASSTSRAASAASGSPARPVRASPPR